MKSQEKYGYSTIAVNLKSIKERQRNQTKFFLSLTMSVLINEKQYDRRVTGSLWLREGGRAQLIIKTVGWWWVIKMHTVYIALCQHTIVSQAIKLFGHDLYLSPKESSYRNPPCCRV